MGEEKAETQSPKTLNEEMKNSSMRAAWLKGTLAGSLFLIIFVHVPGMKKIINNPIFAIHATLNSMLYEKAQVIGYTVKAGAPVPGWESPSWSDVVGGNYFGHQVVGITPNFYLQVQAVDGRTVDIEIPFDSYRQNFWKIGQLVWIKENGPVANLEP